MDLHSNPHVPHTDKDTIGFAKVPFVRHNRYRVNSITKLSLMSYEFGTV